MALHALHPCERREALARRDASRLAPLMDRNCELRIQMFGEAVLGEANLSLVRAVRSVGAACNFTGSGGALVVLCPEGAEQEAALADACASAGLGLEELRVDSATHPLLPAF